MAFLAVPIPNKMAQQLAKIKVEGKREKEDEYHITLIYLGQKVRIDQISKAVKATYQVIKKEKAIPIKVESVICFPPGENGVPIIAKVESKELVKLRAKLARKFDTEGIRFSKKFPDYQPHITLAYGKKEIEYFEAKIDPVKVDQIILFAGDNSLEDGDKLKIIFNLDKIEKFGELESQLELFYRATKA